ncbi:Anti-sigma regulatory factor (Ser/Thr protein kinase) [Nocardioides terrae]|uniref:Anti-sigma regulatory factor (Ser/Thr protein kinase) n=1 Tax=Nocardioides terrae TaxID=574651 RepID=A0A1I1GPF5_9ACTN|nr:ATP-binding protein [Nocardioides terrae]SFC13649.1 Anti-sigma regulatory factor (Ser/Thr protein kinase) [Nocardioides terrae]
MKTQLRGTLSAPAEARRFVLSAMRKLRGHVTRPDTDDIVLVVSELVTNAVRADAAVIGLSLVVEDKHIRLEISDDAEGWPTPRRAGADDLSGRGLAIVDELADRWTTTELRPGKRVTVTWYRG